MFIHVGQKPDRFNFHGANVEITFQEIQTDIFESLIFKDICFISKSKQIKGYPVEIRTLEDISTHIFADIIRLLSSF